MAGYTLHTIASIVSGTLVSGDPGKNMEHLLLDSRKLVFPSTSLFFALRGGSRDGQAFIPELYARGVRAFVVNALPDQEGMPDAAFLLVEDTLDALQALVAAHRAGFTYPVVGITGSNGKTMVKEWLFQLLEEDHAVVRSPRSYNSQIGVPLSVWMMDGTHDLALFEAGISRMGEMEKLERIIRPDMGIFTNIGDAHSEGFPSVRDKILEKLRLFAHVRTLVWCSDQQELTSVVRRWITDRNVADRSLQPMDWGHSPEAAVRIMDSRREGTVTLVRIACAGMEQELKIPFTDPVSVENILHCCAFMITLGMSLPVIAGRMNRLRPLAMRLELKEGVNHCTIINDSYNADWNSVQTALDFLSQQTHHDRRTAILSDIMGSGKPPDELYGDLAASLQRHKVNRLIGIGPGISAHRELFATEGMETAFFPGTDTFLEQVHTLGFRDETILIKGSRAFELERVGRYLEKKLHQTRLEINLSAIADNLRQYRAQLPAGTRVMAMVKAFSYGAGSYEIASLLQFHQVDQLAVAYADEGVELRKAGIHLPIMVLNAEESSYYSLTTYDLEPVLYSFELTRSFSAFLHAEGIPSFPVHIKVDTGMHRLGFDPGEMGELSAFLAKDPAFRVRSVFSHLAAGEDPAEDAFTWHQAERFLDCCAELEKGLGHPFLRHLSNSAAIVRHPGLAFDMVRLGIGLYGVDPALRDKATLREVSTLKTTVAQVRRIRAGETVGYNRKSTLSRDSVIATIRIGYADGFPRSLGNGAGKVWLKGTLAPVIGSICMDMTMVDVTDIPGVAAGEEVILFGKELPIRDLAEWADTIPYEIMTGISQRVQRIYFEE
jgi:alanine racemase